MRFRGGQRFSVSRTGLSVRQQRTRIQAVSYCNKSITRSYNSQFQLANSTMESCVQQLRSELYALRKVKCEYRRHQDLPAAQTRCRYPSRGVRCCIFSRPGSCRRDTSCRQMKKKQVKRTRACEITRANSRWLSLQVVRRTGCPGRWRAHLSKNQTLPTSAWPPTSARPQRPEKPYTCESVQSPYKGPL